jgi:hypothetical protein
MLLSPLGEVVMENAFPPYLTSNCQALLPISPSLVASVAHHTPAVASTKLLGMS